MTDEPTPQFPNYQPPNTGIPVADPKFHKPLYKMMGLMLKPKANLLKTPFRSPKNRRSGKAATHKKTKFY